MKEGVRELLKVILILLLEFVCGTIFLYAACIFLGKPFTRHLAFGVYALMQMVSMYIRNAIIEAKRRDRNA